MRSVYFSLVLSLALLGCTEGSEPSSHGGETLKSDLPRNMSPNADPEELLSLKDGNHQLTVDLYKAVVKQDANQMISPFSIRSAFALLYGGARTHTAEEISSVLHFNSDQDIFHESYNALDLELAQRNKEATDELEAVELHTANSFWGRTGFPFSSSYLDLLATNYGAGIETCDYVSEPEVCRATINTWVEEKTRERIKDLLPQGSIRPNTLTVLVNALFFKAPWANKFNEELTAEGDFHLLDDSTVTADLMAHEEYFSYGEGEDFTAVEVPFREGELAMGFVLPKGEFTSFQSSLVAEKIDTITQSLESAYIRLWIPKFKFETGFNLAKPLQDLGMVTAFSLADFSGMVDGPSNNLAITGVFHKTFVAIDEKGAEAAAATAIVVGETSVPTVEAEFKADRPFFFYIRDRKTGILLFWGHVINPV